MVSHQYDLDGVCSKRKYHRINLLVLRFYRCAQFLLATKIGGATAIKNVGSKTPWDIRDLWQPISDWHPFGLVGQSLYYDFNHDGAYYGLYYCDIYFTHYTAIKLYYSLEITPSQVAMGNFFLLGKKIYQAHLMISGPQESHFHPVPSQ